MNYLYEKKSSSMCRVKAGSSIDNDSRTLEATISSNQVDRDGEVIEPKAFEKRLDTFKSNPVLLSNHDPMAPTPIGRVTEIELQDSTIDAKVQFRPEGDNPVADDIWKAYAGGFMNAFSIGFRVFDVEKAEDKPPIVKDAELFELSTVIIPANTDAMVKTAEHAQRVLKMHGHEMAQTLYAKQGYADTIRAAASICKDAFHRRSQGVDVPQDLLAEIENLQLYMAGIAAQRHERPDEVQKALSGVLDFFKSRASG